MEAAAAVSPFSGPRNPPEKPQKPLRPLPPRGRAPSAPHKPEAPGAHPCSGIPPRGPEAARNFCKTHPSCSPRFAPAAFCPAPGAMPGPRRAFFVFSHKTLLKFFALPAGSPTQEPTRKRASPLKGPVTLRVKHLFYLITFLFPPQPFYKNDGGSRLAPPAFIFPAQDTHAFPPFVI